MTGFDASAIMSEAKGSLILLLNSQRWIQFFCEDRTLRGCREIESIALRLCLELPRTAWHILYTLFNVFHCF